MEASITIYRKQADGTFGAHLPPVLETTIARPDPRVVIGDLYQTLRETRRSRGDGVVSGATVSILDGDKTARSFFLAAGPNAGIFALELPIRQRSFLYTCFDYALPHCRKERKFAMARGILQVLRLQRIATPKVLP